MDIIPGPSNPIIHSLIEVYVAEKSILDKFCGQTNAIDFRNVPTEVALRAISVHSEKEVAQTHNKLNTKEEYQKVRYLKSFFFLAK